MRNISILVNALEIIEDRIKEPLNVTEIADLCYSSCSGLQKLFKYTFGLSVNEYLIKRKITCASRELISSEKSIIEIALDYQYGSPEAFSRAFKRVWGISPKEFRKTRRFTGLLPKLTIDNGGFVMQKRKLIDISDLYDEIKKMNNSYVFCVDIVNFAKINSDYGYAAGDLVIAETFNRLEQNLNENMLLFRIGGDEFAVITGYSEILDAKILAEKILSQNGATAKSNTENISFSLRIGISRLSNNTNYKKALDIMYGSIEKARKSDDYIAVYEN